MSKKLTKQESIDATKALEILFASEYVDKKKLYIANFWRGIYFSIGTVIGLTIAVSLLLWVLSFFKEMPLVGPVFENLQSTVESQQKK